MAERAFLRLPQEPGPSSSREWEALRLLAVRFARRDGGDGGAEDVAQEAIERLVKARRKGVVPDDLEAYLRIIVRNRIRSGKRRFDSKVVLLSEAGERAENSLARENEEEDKLVAALDRSPNRLADAAREIAACMEPLPERDLAMAYLFRTVVAPESSAGSAVPPGASSLRRERHAMRKVALALQRRGINAALLHNVLTTPSAAVTSPWLTRALARLAARVLGQVPLVSKKCRLATLFRTGTDRQEVYAAKLPLFAQNLDALYAAARLSRPYTLLGMVTYLSHVIGARPAHADLIDPGYAERLALDLVHNRPRLDPMDKWLAIVCLGVLYEQAPVGINYVEQTLGPIEYVARHHPVLRSGAAFAWIDAVNREKQLVVREKVYPLLDPERWNAGLSQLPITVIGSYMGSGPEPLRLALLQPDMWLPILQGLQSGSYLANLGALAQLSHMPIHCPPSSVAQEMARALDRLSHSPQPFVRHQANLVPSEYRPSAT